MTLVKQQQIGNRYAASEEAGLDYDLKYLGNNGYDWQMVNNNKIESSYKSSLTNSVDNSARSTQDRSVENAEAFFRYGEFLLKRKRFNDAKNEFISCLDLNQQHTQASFCLAIAYHECNQLDEAESCFKRALELEQDNAEAHLHYSFFLHSLEKSEEAVIHFQNALELNKDYLKNEVFFAARLLDFADFGELRPVCAWVSSRILELMENRAQIYMYGHL